VLHVGRLRLPTPVVTVGAAALATLAIGGLAFAGSASIQTDIDKLSRSGSPELKAINALQRELGSAGELRIDVTAKDVTAPSVVAWMTSAQARMLRVDRRLTPGPDPADLLTGGGTIPDAATLHRLAGLIPPYFLDAVISRDRHHAELSVGIPLAPVKQQQRIVAGVRHALGDPPRGIDAVPGGLVASGVVAVDRLHSSREWVLLGSLLAVFLLLVIARRRLDRALIPLVPAVVVAGLSAFLIHATGLALLPLGAALEPLVLAVGLEFGLLLEARYQEFRAAGGSRDAARRGSQKAVGGAVAVSAATVALAFLCLAVARLSLLRQFGLLVCVELIACAAVAVLTVPWLAAWADGRAGGEDAAERGSIDVVTGAAV
jgi:predicted RND superfamily exporter protein